MTGKIFIHIGLPKTATTTLQVEFYPAIAGDEVTYLGVFQPRDGNTQDPLYLRIYDAIANRHEIGKVNGELVNRLQSGESLIVSEEMITVSQNAAIFHSKLENLSALLNGLDYQIIVTVREPASALFSYYVERYGEFYKQNMAFMDAALKDESMYIFHYRKLADALLANFDRQRVHVYKFENIVKGHLQPLCDLIAPGKHQEKEFHLTNYNKKTKTEGVVLANKRSTAASFLRRHLSNWIERSPIIYGIARNAFRPLSLLLERIHLGEMKVKRPSEADMNRLRVHLHDETAALESEFGVKY